MLQCTCMYIHNNYVIRIFRTRKWWYSTAHKQELQRSLPHVSPRSPQGAGFPPWPLTRRSARNGRIWSRWARRSRTPWPSSSWRHTARETPPIMLRNLTPGWRRLTWILVASSELDCCMCMYHVCWGITQTVSALWLKLTRPQHIHFVMSCIL